MTCLLEFWWRHFLTCGSSSQTALAYAKLGAGWQNITNSKNNKTTNQDRGWQARIQMHPCLNSRECWQDANGWKILHKHSWTAAVKTLAYLKWPRELLSGHVYDEKKQNFMLMSVFPTQGVSLSKWKYFHIQNQNWKHETSLASCILGWDVRPTWTWQLFESGKQSKELPS